MKTSLITNPKKVETQNSELFFINKNNIDNSNYMKIEDNRNIIKPSPSKIKQTFNQIPERDQNGKNSFKGNFSNQRPSIENSLHSNFSKKERILETDIQNNITNDNSYRNIEAKKKMMYNYHMQQNPQLSFLIRQHTPDGKRDYSNPQTPIKSKIHPNENIITRAHTPPPRNIIKHQRNLMKKEESPFKKEEFPKRNQPNKWLMKEKQVRKDYSANKYENEMKQNYDDDINRNLIKVKVDLDQLQKTNNESMGFRSKAKKTDVLDLTKFKKPANNSSRPKNIIESQKVRFYV